MATSYSENTPLLLPPGPLARSHSQPDITTTSEERSPPSARPKPPRTVTFNANPVSETFEPESHHGSHHHPRSVTTSLRNAQLHPLHISPSSTLSSLGGSTPVLSSLNSKLRRRNSHGAIPPGYSNNISPGGSMRFAPGSSFPGGHGYGHHGGMPPPKVGPQRSTKNAQKLKLLPNPDIAEEDGATPVDADDATSRDVYSQYTRIKDPSARRDAARLGKADRYRLPRVTAYCTANKYEMEGLMRFLKGRGKTRGANPKLIDECIYTPYNYSYAATSTQSGNGVGNGHGVGRQGHVDSTRDRDVAAAETVDESTRAEGDTSLEMAPGLNDNLGEDPVAVYGERQATQHSEQTPLLGHNSAVLHSEDSGYADGFSQDETQRAMEDRPRTSEHDIGTHASSERPARDKLLSEHPNQRAMPDIGPLSPPLLGDRSHSDSSIIAGRNPATELNGDYFLDTDVHTPEVFLFDYGVVVIWGMSETQEEKFLKELERFEVEKLALDEVQTELFNFYYTREYQPRIYNDFITLRDKNNYRTKLAISHGLAQSVKTSLFEELVATTIETTKDIPSEIALTGSIALTRSEINMQIGELFILRINIHQSGSVLDTPELFWVEPQLEPVYRAVRSYLEMDRRVKVLTSRLEVIGDLLAVLKDQLSHGHGEKLEWIVIFLIAAEILVAAINIYVDLFIVD